jgi:molybdate transport system ATP-binding protein
MANPFLEIKNLTVKVGSFFLKNLNLSVEKGSYTVILGPSGSGKSTLLETLIGFHRVEEGNIYLNGRDITQLPPEKRSIAIVYQDYLLFPHMNVFENIAYGLKKKYKNDHQKVKKEVFQIAEALKIDHLLEKNVNLLSGGEKQRVAIARAVVVRPLLLLLDEPFSALDVKTKENLRNLIKDIAKKYQLTVLHVSHDLEDAQNLAQKVVFLKKGQILEQGTFEDIFLRAKNSFVASFVGLNRIEGTFDGFKNGFIQVRVGKNLLLGKGHLKEPQKGQKVKIQFRPEEVKIYLKPPSENNILEVLLKEVKREKFLLRLELEIEGLKGSTIKVLTLPSLFFGKEIPNRFFIKLFPKRVWIFK